MAKSKEQEIEQAEKHKKMIELYQSGMGPNEVAEKLGYSNGNCITRQLKRMGIDRDKAPPKVSEEKTKYIIEKYKDGISSETIAKDLDVVGTTVQRKLKDNNITMRSRKKNNLVKKCIICNNELIAADYKTYYCNNFCYIERYNKWEMIFFDNIALNHNFEFNTFSILCEPENNIKEYLLDDYNELYFYNKWIDIEKFDYSILSPEQIKNKLELILLYK